MRGGGVKDRLDVTCINAGVWSDNSELHFVEGGAGSSSVCDSCSLGDNTANIVTIPVQCIDKTDACKNATFIKMDIEGAEYNALEGAKHTIKKNKPKLAICIYHSDEDMVRIAEWIHETVPEYKLRVRQHSNSICETVLYAFI